MRSLTIYDYAARNEGDREDRCMVDCAATDKDLLQFGAEIAAVEGEFATHKVKFPTMEVEE